MWASSKQCLASAGVPRSGFGPKPRCGFLTTTSLPASRRHLLDYVVVSVVEEVGCMDRSEFQRGFENVFGDDLDDTLNARQHASLFQPVRSQGIPCFAQKKRKKGKALPAE